MSTGTAAEPETGSPDSPAPLDVTIVFRSDWGVSTGTGVAGGVDAAVEKDGRDLPVVRGTVLTGAIREQAFVVAEALDGDSKDKRWRRFVGALFGSVGRARLVSFSDARFVSFSEVAVTADDESNREAVHEVVSLSIDEETGTAKKDHLRLLERARACILHGTVELLGETLDGRPLRWCAEQRKAAELVLSISALLVRALGSNRSDGDGLCRVLIGETGEVGETGGIDKKDTDPKKVIEKAIRKAQKRCLWQLKHEQWSGTAPNAPDAPDAPIDPKAGGRSNIPVIGKKDSGHRDGSNGMTFYEADLDIDLTSPVISYDVPFSNELRSLDFLRGTALLPIIHHRLQAAAKKDSDVGATAREIIRDAVVNGDLLVSDATAVVNGVRGMPMPLVLSRPKTEGNDETEGVRVLNRLLAEEPENEIHKPLRAGYVFPLPVPKSADSSEVLGGMGVPALQGRQSTAHNPVTGAAGTGQLFLARALPAGMRLRATVTMSKEFYECVKGRLDGAFRPQRTFPERLGLWRLSGTYGRAECRLGGFHQVEVPKSEWDENGTTTLWFTSDVVARSTRLGPGGSLDDLYKAFERAGVPLTEDDSDERRFSAGIRHRRIDSWSAADRRPRATRTVIQAGSVLRVRSADAGSSPEETMRRLARLSVTGIGELTAQGFGRFVVDHPLLREKKFRLISLKHEDFIADGCAAVKPEGE